ncbi:unnamed protein product [Symbiodinium sp. CCMP2456]|nr:unnamed protein product [Symbiodinium sp. CCMP2456]
MLSWRLFSIWAPLQCLASLRVDSKKDPVTKVVTLLQDMAKQLEVDAKKDEDIYDKMVCWCTETQKAKQKAIDEGGARIESLSAEIEQGVALSARLQPEIESLKKEEEKNKQALEQASAIRKKQSGEFEAESGDLKDSIAAVRKAVNLLNKKDAPRATSFLQVASKASQVKSALRQMLSKSRRWADPQQIEQAGLLGLRDMKEADLLQLLKPGQSAGEIFGMLSQMLETFEQNLKEISDEEQGNKEAFQKLQTAKSEEIETSAGQIRVKEKEKATVDEKLAHDKKDKTESEKALKEDQDFLQSVKQKCANNDAEWDARQKSRREEVKAIGQATQVLTDGRDKLEKKGLSFLQQDQHSHPLSAESSSALSNFLRVTHRFNDPHLSALALRARVDSLAEVFKAIDDMISELKKKKGSEMKKRDFCKDQLADNKLQQEKQERKKEDVGILLETLEEKIKKASAEKDEILEEIDALNTELAKAAQEREEQNKAFQTGVDDQRETQKLLKGALKVLSDYYSKASLLELSDTSEESKEADVSDALDPSAPQGFGAYKKNAGSKGVMAMLQHISEQAEAAEKQAIKDENAAQADYEKLAKETTASVASKTKEVEGKKAAITKAQGDLADAATDQANIESAAKALISAAGTLHSDCDFLLKNFQLRQTSFDDEVGALVEAKGVMKGIGGQPAGE